MEVVRNTVWLGVALMCDAIAIAGKKYHLLSEAMKDKLHQPYRKHMVTDYEVIEGIARTSGAAFCLSGAGPTLLCITRDKSLKDKHFVTCSLF